MLQELCLLPSSGDCLSLWHILHGFYFQISDDHIKIGTLFTLTDNRVTDEYCCCKSTYVTCDSFLSYCTGSHMARVFQCLLADDLF
jgi:hypothetical protein